MMLALYCFVLMLIGASCTADLTVGDLGAGILDEITAILNGVFIVTGQCPPPQPTQVDVLLYTRNNADQPITLNQSNPNQIDPNKPVIMLIHGWTVSANMTELVKLKNVYLQRYDSNVLMIDWSQISTQLYTTCYCVLPQIADRVADFLCILSQKLKIDLNTIYVLGHSLGAQMAGFVGNYTVTKCGQQIGRITGLDPAGPGYQGVSSDLRLDILDALFVDIIHTNGGQFGYRDNCGHVDFHVNCGSVQRGCPSLSVNSLADTLVSVVACSHNRCVDLMAESVNSNQFIAKSCDSCPSICLTDTSNATYIVMGEDCPQHTTKKVFEVPTKSSPPYAAGQVYS